MLAVIRTILKNDNRDKEALTKVKGSVCLCLSNILCEVDEDSSILQMVRQSRVLESAVKPLLFSSDCPSLLKRELLTVYCNVLRRRSKQVSDEFLVYLLDECDVLKAITNGLRAAVQG